MQHYLTAEAEVELASQGNLAYRPSNIVAIDGQPVTDFLTASYNKADHLQDPDAMVRSKCGFHILLTLTV